MLPDNVQLLNDEAVREAMGYREAFKDEEVDSLVEERGVRMIREFCSQVLEATRAAMLTNRA